jgi:hypothetical protein
LYFYWQNYEKFRVFPIVKFHCADGPELWSRAVVREGCHRFILKYENGKMLPKAVIFAKKSIRFDEFWSRC